MIFFADEFSKDYSVKPDNDRTFNSKDDTFSAQLLLNFSFFLMHRLSLARKKLDICHL